MISGTLFRGYCLNPMFEWFLGDFDLLTASRKGVRQMSRPFGWSKLSSRVGPYRSSEKTLFLPNHLLIFVVDRNDLHAVMIFLNIGKSGSGFSFSMRAKRAYSFVFRFWFCRFELSTDSHVKDLIKLKARARALRFFILMKNIRKNSVSVSDNTKFTVSDNTCFSQFSVSDNTCLSTGIIDFLGIR